VSQEAPLSAADSDALVVNRWKRYGMDRLYVESTDERKIGWWDLATDEPHPENPDDLEPLTAAVDGWKTANAPAAEARAPESERASAPVAGAREAMSADDDADSMPVADPAPHEIVSAAERPWVDLATNTPGSAAREQAVSAQASAPVRTLVARAFGIHTQERAWRIGADGEEKVAAQLDKLLKKDPRWRVIHAIPVGNRGSDIDHLIVGPGGLFTANAKHHPGAKIWVGGNTVMVNGNKQPYVRNSRHEANRAAEILSRECGFPVFVEGLIVTVNAADVVVKSQPEGVTVVPRIQVTKWLLRHGEILDSPTIDAIHDVARRSTTWRS
jgi:hypothetical protein